ncbi:MAG TPA: Stk1 family PASTA domain-containing Ser/Thr kinase [Candidatus Lumbricidophila sp.]|nr:Stk1 family PASTA domain-containing Ser/Thr kinase [Candidatus Lumbricidophila sp.]
MFTKETLVADRYRLGDTVGRDAMSDVFMGTDERLNRKVAIKLMRAEIASDPKVRARFRQHARAASRLAHPNIARVFDAGELTGSDAEGRDLQTPFLVSEWVEGQTLGALLHDGPLASAEAARIAGAVLTALEHAHRAGVVHGNLCPSNILVTASGQVKVLDFGVAAAATDAATTVAQVAALLGTAAYLSPEQAKSEPVDLRTDVYSVGVILFELLSGRAPFQAETPVAVAYQHVSELPVAPSSLNGAVSPAFDAVVARALQKRPDSRYQSAVGFRTDLEVAAAGRVPVHTAPDSIGSLFGDPVAGLSNTELALRQLAEDETMVRTQRRPPAVWMWAGIVTVAVMVVAVLYWAVNMQPIDRIPSTARQIPSVAGQSWEAASKTLQDLGLPVSQKLLNDAQVPKGAVIKTIPAEGEIVNAGTPVAIYISEGSVPVTVPPLANLTRELATTAIQGAGLLLGTVTNEHSASVAAGAVIGASPAPGQSVERGSTINLQLSDGFVTIPDLRGKRLADATSLLNSPELGLNVTVVPDATCAAADGSPVTSQSIGPGDVPQRSEVKLTYCAK